MKETIRERHRNALSGLYKEGCSDDILFEILRTLQRIELKLRADDPDTDADVEDDMSKLLAKDRKPKRRKRLTAPELKASHKGR